MVDDYHQIWLGDYAVVFAQTTSGEVIVERQYKQGIGVVSFMLPCGAIQNNEGPLAAAKRELLEETGYISGNWRNLGSFVCNSNYGCGKANMFIANNAKRISEPIPQDLEETEILLMPIDELMEAVLNGEVHTLDVVTVIALATNPVFATLAASE